MKEVVERLRALESALSEERGPFRLFALFLRDDAPGVWDVVVAAEWLDSRSVEDLRLMVDRVGASLGRKLIIHISRVVIVDADNPSVESIAAEFDVRHDTVQTGGRYFFGQSIRHAYIITAQPLPVPSPQPAVSTVG